MKQQDNQDHTLRKSSWLKGATLSLFIGLTGSLLLFWTAGSIIYIPQIDDSSICDNPYNAPSPTRHTVEVSTYTFRKISSGSFLDATLLACGSPQLNFGYIEEDLKEYNPMVYYLASPLVLINTLILSTLSFGLSMYWMKPKK